MWWEKGYEYVGICEIETKYSFRWIHEFISIYLILPFDHFQFSCFSFCRWLWNANIGKRVPSLYVELFLGLCVNNYHFDNGISPEKLKQFVNCKYHNRIMSYAIMTINASFTFEYGNFERLERNIMSAEWFCIAAVSVYNTHTPTNIQCVEHKGKRKRTVRKYTKTFT